MHFVSVVISNSLLIELNAAKRFVKHLHKLFVAILCKMSYFFSYVKMMMAVVVICVLCVNRYAITCDFARERTSSHWLTNQLKDIDILVGGTFQFVAASAWRRFLRISLFSRMTVALDYYFTTNKTLSLQILRSIWATTDDQTKSVPISFFLLAGASSVRVWLIVSVKDTVNEMGSAGQSIKVPPRHVHITGSVVERQWQYVGLHDQS